MRIIYDPDKRKATLAQRGLDMSDAAILFGGRTLTFPDIRCDSGENRQIIVGFLKERMIILVWVRRDDARRIISMRKANDREQTSYGPRFR